MEKLYITNGSKLAPINCLQLKNRIPKDVQLRHSPACDRVKRDIRTHQLMRIRYSYTPEYHPKSRDKCVSNNLKAPKNNILSLQTGKFYHNISGHVSHACEKWFPNPTSCVVVYKYSVTCLKRSPLGQNFPVCFAQVAAF